MKVYYDGNKPVGLVSWVFLTPDREEHYEKTTRLEEEDFRSEEGTLWCLDLISDGMPTRDIIRHLRKLKHKLYPDYDGEIRFLRFGENNRKHKARL